MRTNIEFDERLLPDTESLSDSTTKQQTSERAVQYELDDQSEIRRLRGRLRWDRDLEELRTDER